MKAAGRLFVTQKCLVVFLGLFALLVVVFPGFMLHRKGISCGSRVGDNRCADWIFSGCDSWSDSLPRPAEKG